MTRNEEVISILLCLIIQLVTYFREHASEGLVLVMENIQFMVTNASKNSIFLANHSPL